MAKPRFVTIDTEKFTDGQLAAFRDAEHDFSGVDPGTEEEGGGGPAPSGTGFRHVAAGVEDGAAKLVENSDVADDAGISESKLALDVSTSDLSASLDNKADLESGKVPSAQLPSYVDDVVEAVNFAALPETGEAGKIYVALDTNQTYRWSGSTYVNLSSSVALGETSSTAYRGDRGKTAYDHSQLTSSNPHSVTKTDVGLGSVTNDAQIKAADIDTDGTLTANLDSKVPSQKAVKTYADSIHTAILNGVSSAFDTLAEIAAWIASTGNAATKNVGTTTGTVAAGDDSRLGDARTPTSHATSHKSGGSDAIKLDELAAPTDVTTLNVSSSAHGLAPKLPGDATRFLNGDGGYTIPAGATAQSGVLFTHYANAGNTSTSETDIFSDIIDAGVLAANGDSIEAEYGGNFVSSGTATRQIKLYFGGVNFFDSGALTVSLSAAWNVWVLIVRVSSTVARYTVSMTTEGAALAAYTSAGEITGLTLSGDTILKLTGTAAGVGAATNDIAGKLSRVKQPSAGSSGGIVFSGAQAYNSANQSIPNNTWTDLTFDSENYDTDAFHSTSSNTNRLTIPADGKYSLFANVYFTTNGSGSERSISVVKNGATYLRTKIQPPVSGDGSALDITADGLALVAGDYLTVRVLQDSGGALDVLGGATERLCGVTIRKVG